MACICIVAGLAGSGVCASALHYFISFSTYLFCQFHFPLTFHIIYIFFVEAPCRCRSTHHSTQTISCLSWCALYSFTPQETLCQHTSNNNNGRKSNRSADMSAWTLNNTVSSETIHSNEMGFVFHFKHVQWLIACVAGSGSGSAWKYNFLGLFNIETKPSMKKQRQSVWQYKFVIKLDQNLALFPVAADNSSSSVPFAFQ